MNISDKVKLYILSLALLFLMILLITSDVWFVIDLIKNKPIDWMVQIKKNWLPIVMIFAIGYCYIIWRQFNHQIKGGTGDTLEITECKSENYENLTFLATYIIPFLGFDFSDIGRLVAWTLLVVVIGIIFIRTDKYFANPTLALYGYKIYRVTLIDARHEYKNVIVITQNDLRINQNVHYKYLSESIFFVRTINCE